MSSGTAGPRTAAQLRRLRTLLPRRTALLVGGDGAPRGGEGVERVTELRALDAWARRAAGRA